MKFAICYLILHTFQHHDFSFIPDTLLLLSLLSLLSCQAPGFKELTVKKTFKSKTLVATLCYLTANGK